MKVSKKLMTALSEYWLTKFGKPAPLQIDAEKLLSVPTLAEINDPQNIFGIAYNVRCELIRLEIGENALESYQRYGFIPIIYYFSQFSQNTYSKELLDEYADEVKKCYERRQISILIYRIVHRIALFIEMYYNCGQLQKRDLVRNDTLIFRVSDTFEELVHLFTDKISDYRSWGESSITSCCSSARRFLSFLEQDGVCSLNSISCKMVSDSMTKYAKCLGGGRKAALHNVRIFLRLLYDEGILTEDFSMSVPTFTPHRVTIKTGFKPDEINRLLASVDKNTRIGKRDYAVMLIAVKTGLRAVDIANLKFHNINWRTHEIKLIQQKTGNELSLPLMPEVGNAIADYILTARPEDASQEDIFVKTSDPAKNIGRKTVCSLMHKYIKLSGINPDKIPNRGFHSFRRSFALELLETDIPVDMLCELLGDTDINSVKPYLAIDEKGLQDCALGLVLANQEGKTYASTV